MPTENLVHCSAGGFESILFPVKNHHRQPTEVQDHIRTTYLQQLPIRLAKIKQLYIDRNWAKLRLECGKLGQGAEKHALPRLAELAHAAAQVIPPDADSLVFSLDDAARTALFTLLESDSATTY